VHRYSAGAKNSVLFFLFMEYKNLSLLELSDLIKNGEATSEDIFTYFLERAERYNAELNAFTTLPEQNPPNPLSQGGIEVSNQQTSKPANLPIAVKDLFCETGIRTTAASKMLEDFVPPYESTVTDRMKKAGFTAFGKTNMDEYAMGGSGENSAFGPSRNPWDPSRIP
jgi:aspartyl-tRNA(Asn)/glutamyl-tRNA(Gln) amidotransferase subunit A